jgi:arylsulfatase A-like enzyme
VRGKGRTRTVTAALTGLSLCLAAAWLSLRCVPPREARSLNLLFISIDTLRADHLGYHGYPRRTSPNIDRFAASNVVFHNFFATSPKTGPSMATFFTGKYVQNHGVTENPLPVPDEQRLLAELLPDEFSKAAIVANPTLAPVRGYAAGFDEFALVEGSSAVTNRALQWLAANEESRFFLWLHYLDPHGPYTPPERLREVFVGDAHYDESRRVPLDYTPQPGLNPNYVLGAVPRYQRLDDIDIVDYYVAQYDAEILFIDEQIGRILEHLEISGLDERTLVVLTSDHGESLGEHDYYFEHGLLVNEGSIHIPLIVSHPELEQHHSIEALTQNTDLLPTLLTQLEVAHPTGMDGLDLSEMLRSGARADLLRDYVYSCTPFPTEYPTFFETVRTRTDKLVRSADGRLWYHDLRRDPRETTNSISSLDPTTLEQWSRIFDGFGRRAVASDLPPTLPDELRERLESLGYAHP